MQINFDISVGEDEIYRKEWSTDKESSPPVPSVGDHIMVDGCFFRVESRMFNFATVAGMQVLNIEILAIKVVHES